MTVKRSLHLAFVFLWAAAAQAQSERPPAARISLEKGWAIQSSAKVADKGGAISTAAYKPRDWYPSSVPSTVLTALVNNKVYPEPVLRDEPALHPGHDATPSAPNFSNLPMPEDSPFAVSWWYRTEFTLPAAVKGKTLWLNFDAINYRANIWLNGHRIATAGRGRSACTACSSSTSPQSPCPGGQHPRRRSLPARAERSRPHLRRLESACRADKDMGLVRDVYVLTSGPVALRNRAGADHISTPSLDTRAPHRSTPTSATPATVQL